jgi:hypothetical protein
MAFLGIRTRDDAIAGLSHVRIALTLGRDHRAAWVAGTSGSAGRSADRW